MPEKKRSKRKLQECPYCKRSFGNVKNHVLMFHQAEAAKQPPGTTLTKEDLLGQRKEGEEKPGESPGPGTGPQLGAAYHCTNCNAALRKDENPCHQCGERLIWEGIE